jgi:hypothetical protein
MFLGEGSERAKANKRPRWKEKMDFKDVKKR